MSIKYNRGENIKLFGGKFTTWCFWAERNVDWKERNAIWHDFSVRALIPTTGMDPIIVNPHENAPTYIYYYEIDRCACQSQGKHEHFPIDFGSKLHFSFISPDQTFAN